MDHTEITERATANGTMADIEITGLESAALAEALANGVDHGGNAIEPFVDPAGGWPLRCCLADSEPGDEIAIIAWSPFPWRGPYAETGPVVVHTRGCAGSPVRDRLPDQLDTTPMTLRPYGVDRRIAYDRVRHVPAGDSLMHHLRELLDDPDVELVHGRNVRGGCYSFQARLASRSVAA
ncbi:MAG: DUF1203 domain-containing protein [Actinomycetota bacterium]